MFLDKSYPKKGYNKELTTNLMFKYSLRPKDIIKKYHDRRFK